MDMNMKRMMADIESEVHYTRSMIDRDALDPRVMQVMAQVPRTVLGEHLTATW